MKKICVLLLSTVMLFSLIGCGSNSNTATPAETENISADITVEEESAAEEIKNEDTVTNENSSEELTLGNKLAELFLTSISESNDIEAIANDLAAASEMDCMVVEAKEGFLNGFSEEVNGFNSGVQFSPMIGSIPFVAYIFETADAEALKETLTNLADPRWNICTEAAETVCVTSGNYVFFTMCPGDEELNW